MEDLTSHLSTKHSNKTTSQRRRNHNLINRNSNDNCIISSAEFYSEFHGHKVSHLQKLLPHLRRSSSSLIWTAGDSSLDNKYWFSTRAETVEGSGYEEVLRPQQSICDVTYWLNYLAKEKKEEVRVKELGGVDFSAINTAGEMK